MVACTHAIKFVLGGEWGGVGSQAGEERGWSFDCDTPRAI